MMSKLRSLAANFALPTTVAALLTTTALLTATAVPARAQEPLAGYRTLLQKNDHGLGASVDFKGGMLGFAYRRYFGNTALQLNILPLYFDRGDYMAIFTGAQIVRYMLLWPAGRSGLGTATALRLVGGAGTKIWKEQEASFEVDPKNCTTQACKDLQGNKSPTEWLTTGTFGFGLEFGALQRRGLTLSIDLQMTVAFDDEGFYGAYPLPYGAVMYNW